MIINADILKWCETYDGPKFHAVLCDPPYELGFMGKSWDSTGIAFDKETWRTISKHLYPGAYLLAFGGTRTFHRIAVAIEDAGFEIRDTVMWVYGSGFPKSHNLKGEWVGYGTALKPSWEPIIIARKPLEGTVAQNALKYGSGALNIDECRVGTEDDLAKNYTSVRKSDDVMGERGYKMGFRQGKDSVASATESTSLGRWPANLIHDGSDEVVGMFPNSGGGAFPKKINGKSPITFRGDEERESRIEMNDAGSAARFFYSAKVSKSERDAGLEGFEERQQDESRKEGNPGGDNPRNRGVKKLRNHHPTLKPISLTTYLAKLILPPIPARLLVPFSGSGSEVIGALKAGWDEVVGIEQDAEYCKIAEARIAHWTQQETLI